MPILPVLSAPDLILLPLNPRIADRQLAGQPFTLELPELGPVRFDTAWPGDALARFPLLAEDETLAGGWILIHGGEAVGMIGPKGALSGAVEIGYGLRSPSWNRGLATQAARTVSVWLLSLPEVARVTAETAVGNAASARVLQKVGFRETGRGHSDEDGELRLWALNSEDLVHPV